MKDFNSDNDVKEWMSTNGGIDGLRRALARSQFGGQNKTLAAAWLHIHDQKQADSRIERSIAAAEQSALSSRDSARWAMWAAIIALVTVIVVTFQFLSGT